MFNNYHVRKLTHAHGRTSCSHDKTWANICLVNMTRASPSFSGAMYGTHFNATQSHGTQPARRRIVAYSQANHTVFFYQTVIVARSS
jgi:hypothetical protein